MQRRYVTADVFTQTALQGNPVAVVLDAEGLSTAQMQAIAVEFNYSETTFVLPPRNPTHRAQVRIFTPEREIPFAGHPNVGTAFVLARQDAAAGRPVAECYVFEEAAGLVPIVLWREDQAGAVGGELTAPEPLSRHAELSAESVAACLSLRPEDICLSGHAPQVASVGLPFVIVELASRTALGQIVPDAAALREHLPRDGAVAIYAYTWDTQEVDCDIQARMFAARLYEDPATGSATAAATALIAATRGLDTLALRVAQGVEMGRPSLLRANVRKATDDTVSVHVGGRCVVAMEGSFELAGLGEDDPTPD